VTGRVVLVATSPRIPPGLLSWPAWQALRSGPVLVGDAGHPQLAFLRDAGVDIAVLTRPGGPPSGDRELAARLHEQARSGRPVVWLSAGTADDALVRALGELVSRSREVALEVVYGSYDPAGARLLDVVAVMDRLRSPGGCPWDAAQSHSSLMPYLLEESYEAYQALEDGDLTALREELGDVLLQVAFHARLAEELPADRRWSLDDVAGDLVDKLVRRHPHVFTGASADDLEGSWEAVKAAEKGRASVTDGVPLAQPALALAAKLQRRARRLGVPLPAYDGPGGQLWDVVARCAEQGVDPEAALRMTARAFRDRLATVEGQLLAAGRDATGLTGEQWQAAWAGPAP